MVLRWTPEFREQARRHALTFTCEECGHFDAARATCAHEWPTALHRRARYDVTADATPPSEIVFCKEFDGE